MAHGDLCKADLPRELAEPLFMRAMRKPVHQHNRDGTIAGRMRIHKGAARMVNVKRTLHRAIIAHALADLDHMAIGKVRLLDIEGKRFRARLIADLNRVAEPLGNGKDCRRAFLLQQRIGGNGRSHTDGSDARQGNTRPGRQAEKSAHAMQGRIVITFRVFRQELAR